MRSTLPRILVLGYVLPGNRDGGGVLQDVILQRYPKDRYVCFATEPPEQAQFSRRRPESLRGVPYLVGPLVPRPGARGTRFYVPLLRAVSLRSIAPLRVRQAVSFGRRHAVELVWAVLYGDAVVLAERIASQLGVPLVGTVWDDPAGWLADGNYDRRSRRLLWQRFREAVQTARNVSTAGEAMQTAYQKDYGVRSVILRHGFERALPPQDSGTNDDVSVGFAGSVYGRDAWDAFLAAAARLSASGRSPPIRVRAFGAGTLPYGRSGVRIENRGWQPPEVMLREIAQTDFCYLPYWFDPAKRRHVELSFPNKFETYLAAGRPVLFHGPEYADVAQAVRQYGVGLCVHSLDQDEILKALERLIKDRPLRQSFSRAALAAFHAEFNAAVMMDRFAELIGVDPALLSQPVRGKPSPVAAHHE